MTNASNFKCGFTHDSNPKSDNTKIGYTIDINLCKSTKAKTSVISYLRVFRVGITKFVTQFEVAVRGKASLKIAGSGHFVLMEQLGNLHFYPWPFYHN